MDVQSASSYPRRRPLPAAVEAGDADSSRRRKRIRFSVGDSDDDDGLEAEVVEEDEMGEQTVESETEHESSSDGSDGDDDDVEDQPPQPAAEEDDSDDDIPIMRLPRAGCGASFVRRRSNPPAPVPAPAAEEGDDSLRPVVFRRTRAPLALPRRGSTAAPAPLAPALRRGSTETDYAGDDDDDDDDVEDEHDEEQPQGGGDQPPPQPPAEEEDDSADDGRVLPFVRQGSTAAAPQAPAMAPPAAPPEPSPSSCSGTSSVVRDVTVEKDGALDCGICYRPLKPPIFQCTVGHVVCSRCSGKLGEARSCHKCRAPTPGGYRRAYDMESLVDAIRVPCPHAARGCAHRPAYHDRDAHARACPRAPACRCPGEACGFAGTTPAALVAHFAAAHGCPCAEGRGNGYAFLSLRDGFNFVTAPFRPAGAAAADDDDAEKYLFLLKVERAPPFGRAVTAFCIHPDRAATAQISLTYTLCKRTGGMLDTCQSSQSRVVCTDLSDGLPDPSSSNCFMFVVPGANWQKEDSFLFRITQAPMRVQ